MVVLGGVRADRLISQVVSVGNLNDAASRQAVDKLKGLGRSAVPKIISLLGTSSPDRSELLTQLLRRVVDEETMEYCLEGLASRDQRVVAGIVSALKGASHVDPGRLLSLFDNPAVSRPAILTLLGAQKCSLNPEALLRCANKVDHNDQSALFGIIEEVADAQLVPALILRLDAQNAGLRACIARALSRFRGPATQAALHRLLTDEDKAVRLAALEGLSRMDADVDVEQVCRLLRDTDINIQNKAIELVIRRNHPETVRYLLDVLQDESEHARRAAVEVLNGLANAGAVKDLLVAIKDSDWWVRSRAADALGKIGGPRVVDSVIQLIKDEDEFVRRAAVEIINATKDQRTFDSLMASLEDSDWWVRERAIDALAALGNKKAAPALIRLIERPGQEEALKLVAIRGLAKLGATAALKPISAQLQAGSTNLKREAMHALSALVDHTNIQVVVSAINGCLTDAEPGIRQMAAEISQRSGTAQSAAGKPLASQPGTVAPLPNIAASSASSMSQSSPASATVESIDTEKLKPGDVLGDRYRFIKPIGKGAFGAVFLMEDLMIKEEIILKFLNANMASDESIIKRFVYELRFARKITHRNVIRIFDMVSFGSSSAISMEYFPSHTLAAEMRGHQPLDPRRALGMLQDVCAGMEAAHQADVVHRDLKPSNILINDEGLLKIVDFGVAAAARNTDTRLTQTGLVIGTPTYMAPEQVLGKPIDARTDIYSLGIIMYEMLTGSPPYTGGDSISVMYQHVQGKPRSPRELNPRLPLALSAIILKAMAADPDARFQSMGELAARLAASGH